MTILRTVPGRGSRPLLRSLHQTSPQTSANARAHRKKKGQASTTWSHHLPIAPSRSSKTKTPQRWARRCQIAAAMSPMTEAQAPRRTPLRVAEVRPPRGVRPPGMG